MPLLPPSGGPRRVPRPALPEERPVVDREAWRDLRATVRGPQLDDVVKAYGVAGVALEEGDVARALDLLRWAKQAASRSAVVREALGVALYAAGDYAEAHSELLAYRRMAGSADQNHLLADCARALGRYDKVDAYVEELEHSAAAPAERRVEGLIVLAGARADRGEHEAALAALARAGLEPDHIEPWHPRLWYVAAELAGRLGRDDEAREYLEAIAAVDADYLDVADRLGRG